MKRTWIAGVLGILILTGCNERLDRTPPAAPRGLYSVTGDGMVTLHWQDNTENDLDHYVVYSAVKGATGPFTVLGTTRDVAWVDRTVHNGSTYWYAVSAVDRQGNEGDLSVENIHDTPRPEGTNLQVWNAYLAESRGGLYASANGMHFSTYDLVDYRQGRADVYYSAPPGHSYLVAGSPQTAIQDGGTTPGGIEQYDFAPTIGWLYGGQLELIPGHTYVIWTADDHYAKVFVRQVGGDFVTLDWAYQVDRGNRELKVSVPAATRTTQIVVKG
jgi:hypothetical protein